MAHLSIKFKTLTSFSTLFFLLFSSVFSAELSDHEAAYLLKLRDALTPAPSDWFNITYMCEWSGVFCGFDASFNSRYVQGINLDSTSLTGTVPSGLNNSLSRLKYLDLGNNSLSGPFPCLAGLMELEAVTLYHNKFTSIPDGCFRSLDSLRVLTASYNTNLAPWKFPTDLTDSTQLSILQLAATNLVDPLPEIFDSFPNLLYVFLSNNSITGVLPKSFAQSKIEYLWFSYQKYNLSGTIEVLSSMTDLILVDLRGNRLEGPIPDLSNCKGLNVLQLDDNRLTGVVPPSLMSLSSLTTVSLGHNLLQGPVPMFKQQVNVSLGVNTSNNFCLDHVGPCDQQVTTLLEIASGFGYPYLLANSWRGNNPCQHWSFIVCDGAKIRTVNLAKQNLTGTISPAFGNLTNLWNLYLGGNNLRGPIPESLATLPQLKVLDVSNNNLSGRIPRFSSRVLLTTAGNVLLDLSQANATSPAAWIAGASVGGVAVILVFVAIICNRKRCLSLLQKMMLKKTRAFVDHNVVNLIKSYGSLAPKQYSYTEVKRMANSFREKLGQGGYGIVYRASLTDGRQVAVKELKESKGSVEEFVNEVVTISRTSHVNIVSLLGFCYEKNKRVLIYEFMPNGSLDKFIYRKGSSDAICNLNWSTLYQITISIARGLEYLHRGCNTRILHLDIKPQNILLDENFCPKIADFGLAKICKKDESTVSIMGARGTPGYIAPEVFSRIYGGVSHKSDVYSYGMLILEMVRGRRNFESGGSHTSEAYFPDWIYKDLVEGNILVSCLPNTEEENGMVIKITLVSLWCIQPNPSDRPSMSKVVEMLEGPLQSVPYPPKPTLYSPERPSLQFSDKSHNNAHETNSITIEENGSIK